MKRLAILGLVLITFALPISAQPKYGVTVIADKSTDFKKLKTYVWQSGWDAQDKKVHGQIVADVDRELKALGFELKTSGPSDVVVKYATLRRIDVDTSTKTIDETRSQIDVGSLLVLMLEPGTGKELFRARVDQPISIVPERVAAAVSTAVTEIFAQYPTRAVKK